MRSNQAQRVLVGGANEVARGIRLKIEKSADKEDILLLLARLESDGVAITHDVYAAIVATLEFTKLGAIE